MGLLSFLPTFIVSKLFNYSFGCIHSRKVYFFSWIQAFSLNEKEQPPETGPELLDGFSPILTSNVKMHPAMTEARAQALSSSSEKNKKEICRNIGLTIFLSRALQS